MTAHLARRLLGVRPGADASVLRAAFGRAARDTHPDRIGGDAGRFRDVLEAYEFLKSPPVASEPEPTAYTPKVRSAQILEISPRQAASGGEAEISLDDGRRLKLTLPAGLRQGDRVRAGEAIRPVEIRGETHLTVRGHDLWVTIEVSAATLRDGGRIFVDTPLGEQVLWVSRKAGARGLVRMAGAGLPARGPHAAGDLFVRLQTGEPRPESAVRAQLRRFADVWAA